MIRSKLLTVVIPSISATLSVPEKIATAYMLLVESGMTLSGEVLVPEETRVEEHRHLLERWVSDRNAADLGGFNYHENTPNRIQRHDRLLMQTFELALDSLADRGLRRLRTEAENRDVQALVVDVPPGRPTEGVALANDTAPITVAEWTQATDEHAAAVFRDHVQRLRDLALTTGRIR